MYYNYKLFYSIVLLAVSDSKCQFLSVDMGGYGEQSDGGTYTISLLSGYMKNASYFPPPCFIDGLSVKLPYLFLANDAYPLQRNLIKPYSHQNLTDEQQIFNGRLSHPRHCVECVFEIFANKWRLLLKAIKVGEDHATRLVKCLTVLQNVFHRSRRH